MKTRVCEVCGKEGDWWPESKGPPHNLCARHRDDWFKFALSHQGIFLPFQHPAYDKRWEEVFGWFVAEAKGQGAVIPEYRFVPGAPEGEDSQRSSQRGE